MTIVRWANTKPKARLVTKAEWVNPSRYDDEGQNVGDENVGVEFDGVRDEAGGLFADGIGWKTDERAPSTGGESQWERLNASGRPLCHESFRLPFSVFTV